MLKQQVTIYLVQHTVCSLFTLTLILVGHYVLNAYLNITHNKIFTINKKFDKVVLKQLCYKLYRIYRITKSSIFYQNIHPSLKLTQAINILNE